ncbi:MAG: sensor histidine kinase [Myxococcaceae bacterium]
MSFSNRAKLRACAYVALCVALPLVVVLLARQRSVLLGTLLLFTTLFVLLFPKPLASVPPLLALPLSMLVAGSFDPLTLLWHTALNFLVVSLVIHLRRRDEKLQALQLELALSEERNRIAREIHDGVGASLATLLIQAEHISPALRETAQESMDELRQSLKVMRNELELADYVRTFEERTRLRVSYEELGPSLTLTPDQQLAMFRALQESLTNCAKHAGATQVKVVLRFEEGRATLEVTDDGKGFDPTQGERGFGLRGLRERARKTGGEATVTSALGRGTSTRFWVPT